MRLPMIVTDFAYMGDNTVVATVRFYKKCLFGLIALPVKRRFVIQGTKVKQETIDDLNRQVRRYHGAI